MKKETNVQKGVINTKSSKTYRELMQKVNNDMDYWSKTVEKATGQHKDEVLAEIQAIYIDNLRKADDLQIMAKENVANLMMKQKVSTHLRQKLHERALIKAEESGDEEAIEKAEASMLEYSMNTKEDYKIFKAVNDGIKTISSLQPKVVKVSTHSNDDKEVFDILEGTYTEE